MSPIHPSSFLSPRRTRCAEKGNSRVPASRISVVDPDEATSILEITQILLVFALYLEDTGKEFDQ